MYLLEHENPNAPIRGNGKRGWYYASRRKQIRGITVHSPQALDPAGVGDGTAEQVARYFAQVDRPASAHVNVDSDSIVELLPDDYTAFHAAGVNSETLGAETGWLFDSWDDDPVKTDKAMRLFAEWAAPKCVAYDIPLVRVQLKADWDNGARGFLEHSITEGWRGQAGRRRDPGEDFPWPVFFMHLGRAIDALSGDNMALTENQQNAVDHLLDVGVFSAYTVADPADMDEPVPLKRLAIFLSRLYTRLEQDTLPAPVFTGGLQYGDSITFTATEITLKGKIEETS